MNLEWHERRMKHACHVIWHIDIPFVLSDVIAVPDEFLTGLVRCKITYGPDIRKTGYEKESRRFIRSLRMVEDNDIDYSLKYADRTPLDSLFTLRGTSDEIIIVKNGLITDTSMSNLVFFDGENWHTPRTPLLKGTCRERLIAAGWLNERDIRPSDLGIFKGCKLVNAMRDPWDESLIPVSEII